jgi:uridine kinase
VILEGVLLYREPINEYFDCRIFLDISFEEVIKRASLRDVPKYGTKFLEKYKQKYIPIQQWYLEKYKPKEISNCVIDNADYNCPKFI